MDTANGSVITYQDIPASIRAAYWGNPRRPCSITTRVPCRRTLSWSPADGHEGAARRACPNYSICGIPYYASGEVPHWRDLADRTRADLEAAGMALRLDTTARGIDVQGHKLLVTGPDGAEDLISHDQPRHRQPARAAPRRRGERLRRPPRSPAASAPRSWRSSTGGRAC